MSKNFETLEVGGWYRVKDGDIAHVDELLSNGQFSVVHMNLGRGWKFRHQSDGRCYSDSNYSLIERVANAQGDPWMPEEKTKEMMSTVEGMKMETRPFKVGDVVKVKGSQSPNGFITKVCSDTVVSCLHENGEEWERFIEDLTLIKAVNESTPSLPTEEAPALEDKYVTTIGFAPITIRTKDENHAVWVNEEGDLYVYTRDGDQRLETPVSNLDTIIEMLTLLKEKMNGLR